MFLRGGRKHSGKRRKCWFPAFSPFLTMFSKGSFPLSLKLGIVKLKGIKRDWYPTTARWSSKPWFTVTLQCTNYIFQRTGLDPCTANPYEIPAWVRNVDLNLTLYDRKTFHQRYYQSTAGLCRQAPCYIYTCYYKTSKSARLLASMFYLNIDEEYV